VDERIVFYQRSRVREIISLFSLFSHRKKSDAFLVRKKILTDYLHEISQVPAHLNPHLRKMRIVRDDRIAGRPGRSSDDGIRHGNSRPFEHAGFNRDLRREGNKD
jgi:hypothetical protein